MEFNYENLQNALTWLGYTKSAPQTVFGGEVVSNAAGSVFPSGWTVTSIGSGRYSITHNLNTTAYVVMLTTISGFENVGSRTSKAANTFEVTFFTNSTGATWPGTDTDFQFTLIKQ